MENKFLELTNTVYKILEFFPESDPLKNRAKDRALAIMEHPTKEDIDVLLGYLWIGKSQGWLNSVNCLIITNEYDKIKKEIGLTIELTQKLPGMGSQSVLQAEEPKISPEPVLNNAEPKIPFSLSKRQSQILEFLSQNEKAQVMDLRAILPDVTKRTIRRDLDELLEAGKIVRLGEFNQVFYKAKG
jgi:DNA-binding transcriptional ArsR family regulator